MKVWIDSWPMGTGPDTVMEILDKYVDYDRAEPNPKIIDIRGGNNRDLITLQRRGFLVRIAA